ncbi:MAG: hypothetical protein R3307_04205 [Anaerolineales bacterium]|nr:hypothetical protein [Anaerolineales bacterium]
MKQTMKKIFAIKFMRHGLIPAGLYFILFCLLTYPLILDFSTHFFTDDGDGLMNVWNLWWIDTAVSQPSTHASIWHTDMLHWPFGVTLRGQTLNPFNGLFAVPLLRVMSLVQAHNTIVIFAFVMSGVTAYWLSYYLTKSFWGSLVAGYIFTFSSYHFAHYYGHLNLISMEWIPLFVLCWIVLITRPSVLMGLASALTLWLVLLCDYYYFFYCVLAGVLIALWYIIVKKKIWLFLSREYLTPLSVFIVSTLILTGPIILPLMYLMRTDPLLDAHNPEGFGLDLLVLFIPGETWRFGHLTEGFWSKLPIGISEASVYLGYLVILLLVFMWMQRKNMETAIRGETNLWFFLIGFFFLMALGPVLRINGKPLFDAIMPYTVMEKVLPFLKLSGVPVRMVVMVTLSASVLSARAVKILVKNFPRQIVLASFVIVLLFVEHLPGPLPVTSTDMPEYVTALEELPNDGGLLDLAAPTKHLHLYYQTRHRKPLVFGYIARTPTNVAEKEKGITRAINREEFVRLWDEYEVRYIVTKSIIDYENSFVSIDLVYQDDEINIYRLECICE